MSRALIVAGSYSGTLYGLELLELPQLATSASKQDEHGASSSSQPSSPPARVFRLVQSFAAVAHVGCVKCVSLRGAILASGSTDENIQFVHPSHDVAFCPSHHIVIATEYSTHKSELKLALWFTTLALFWLFNFRMSKCAAPVKMDASHCGKRKGGNRFSLCVVTSEIMHVAGHWCVLITPQCRGAVNDVSLHPVLGRALLSCGRDGTLRMWDLLAGNAKLTIRLGYGLS